MLRHIVAQILLGLLAAVLSPTARAQDAPLGGLLGKAKRLKQLYDQIPQIYRVQFRVQTSRHSGAGTRSDILVSLSDRHRTWIDAPGDDREQGVVSTYDLFTLDYLRHPLLRLDDIEYLEIENAGGDHWAIVFFELLVNGQVVYHERFPDRHWIGRGKGRSTTYRVSRETLRGSDAWRAWTYRIPEALVIPRADLEDVMEGYVGHHILTEPEKAEVEPGEEKPHILDWAVSRFVQDKPGGPTHALYDGIRLSRVDDSTVRIRMEATAKENNLPNPDFRLEVTIRFRSEGNTLTIRFSRVQVDGRGATGYLAGVFTEIQGRVNRKIERKVTEAGKQMAEYGSPNSLRMVPDGSGDVELTIRDLPFKISLRVNPDGDLQIVPYF